MKENLTAWLYTMLCSGCICGLILYVCPSGKIKELMEIGAVCAMLLAFLSPLTGWKGEAERELSELLRDLELQEQVLTDSGEELMNSLIEREYEAYIFTEAEAQGIALSAVEVLTVSDNEQSPVPMEIHYHGTGTIPEDFKERIAAGLGVAVERQYTYETTTDPMAGGTEE